MSFFLGSPPENSTFKCEKANANEHNGQYKSILQMSLLSLEQTCLNVLCGLPQESFKNKLCKFLKMAEISIDINDLPVIPIT